MQDQTLESEESHFIGVALRHGLLTELHAEKILDHAYEHDLRPSDAALILSILQLHEVDATNLLCDPTSLAPGYELTDLIGCGAGGMVFRARQTTLGRDVALKTINQSSRNAKTTGEPRIQREAHAIAQLKHPGIVAAIDSVFHHGRFCIAMELVEGENLVDFIKRESPVAEHIAWQIARQVACALSHANAAGIIHRDIKPANLLLCKHPTGMQVPAGVPFVKVADFGLALLSSEHDASQITATGTSLGTPAYVAPEQLMDSNADARADIYSLGATVFHMLTGKAPCADQSPMRTIMQKTIGEDRWRNALPESVSQQTVSLFRDMTEANVDERIADYETLLDRIDRLIEQAPIEQAVQVASKTDVSKQGSLIRRVGGRRTVVSIAAVSIIIMVCTIAGVGGSFRPDDSGLESIKTPTDWTFDGFPQPLFNGVSSPTFLQRGLWTLGVTNDGSRVLSAQPGAWMTIPLAMKSNASQNLQLRLAISIDSESIAEIGLRFPNQELEKVLLRVREGIAEVVHAESAEEDGGRASISLPPSNQQDTVFHRVTFIRGGNQITFMVNGKSLGTIPCDPNAAAFIQLRSIAGTVNFADIDIVALRSNAAR